MIATTWELKVTTSSQDIVWLYNTLWWVARTIGTDEVGAAVVLFFFTFAGGAFFMRQIMKYCPQCGGKHV